MYSLEDIYEQADKDRFAVSLDNDYYKSKLVYGVKIIKDNQLYHAILQKHTTNI